MLPVNDKLCPYCGSCNILPHEEENDLKQKHTFSVIILSVLILIFLYFLLMVSVYLNFTAIVVLGLIITPKFIARKEKRKTRIAEEKDYLCLDCSRNFTLAY